MLSFDTSSTLKNVNSTSTGITGNTITPTAGSGNILLVAIGANPGLSTLAMTYNGVSMTQIATGSDTGSSRMYIFALIAPATGSAIAPVATWTSVSSNVFIQSFSYLGALQTALPSVFNNTTASVTGAGTASITTDANPNSWIVGWFNNNSGTFTAGSGVGALRNQSAGTGFTWADSNATVPISASYSMSFTWTGGTIPWQALQIELLSGIQSTLAAAQGAYTLTGVAALLVQAHIYTLALVQGAYTLAGQVLAFANTLWPRPSKSSTAFTTTNKDSSAWTDTAKDASTFTTTPKSD